MSLLLAHAATLGLPQTTGATMPDDSEFLLLFPAWTLAKTDKPRLPGDLYVIVDPDTGNQSVPLFSEELFAESFVRSLGHADVRSAIVASFEYLELWLPTCPLIGVTHATVDPSEDSRRYAWQESIRDFLARLKRGGRGFDRDAKN